MELQIRVATKADFNSVFRLLKQLWPDSELDYIMLFEVYKKSVESEKQKLIVGEYMSNVIGFCSMTIKNSLW